MEKENVTHIKKFFFGDNVPEMHRDTKTVYLLHFIQINFLF